MIIMRANGTKQGPYGETFADKRFVYNDMVAMVQDINRVENYEWYETKIEILDIIGADLEDLKSHAAWLGSHGYWFELVQS